MISQHEGKRSDQRSKADHIIGPFPAELELLSFRRKTLDIYPKKEEEHISPPRIIVRSGPIYNKIQI